MSGIDWASFTAMAVAPATTPDCEPHTPGPGNYLARCEWADDMSEAGWVQRKCKGCGQWLIWEPSGDERLTP